MTDVDNLGPHLLGRKVSPPDERDFRAANFMHIGAERSAMSVTELAALAVSELQKTTITYKRWAATHYDTVQVTHWWKAFNALAQIGNFPIPTPSSDILWESKIQLDQGDTGHCVGFGNAAWGIAKPIEDVFDNADGHAIYYEAKAIEGDPKGEDGAYVRDGAKAMVARKRMSTYAFLYTIDEILAWIRTKGPVVVGSDWTDGMFEPDADGVATPSGSVVGGHCYLLIGIAGDYLIFKNSWGSGWGDNGYFRMKISDFVNLFDNYGEAVASVELPL